MTSSLAKVNKSGAHFRALFLKFTNFLMFLNIQIDLLILKTYDGQFTLTTKKSLHIIFNIVAAVRFVDTGQVVNVLREERMTKISNAYRPHLTSHITLPSHHRAGITLFVTTLSPAFDELQHSSSIQTVASNHPTTDTSSTQFHSSVAF